MLAALPRSFSCPPQTVLVSSDVEGVDHAVRYLSLYDNQFLRYFAGHTDKVVSIAMSPTDDHFMTGSKDRCVMLTSH